MSHHKDKERYELRQRGYEVDDCICGWPKATTDPRCTKCMAQPDLKSFAVKMPPFCPFGLGMKRAESLCKRSACALWDHEYRRCYFVTGVKWLGDLAISGRISEASSNVRFRKITEDRWEARTEVRGTTYIGNGKDQATAKAALMEHLEHIGEKVGS